MPLPLFEADQAARPLAALGGEAAAAPGERDHEDATWYRLVTALASCASFVTGHTELDQVRFVVSRDGSASCIVGTGIRWEVSLSPAAHRAFPVVVELWQQGAFNKSDQVHAISLGVPVTLSDGAWSVEVTPSLAPHMRTRTMVRR